MNKITLPVRSSIGRPEKHWSLPVVRTIVAGLWFALTPLAQAVVPAPDGGYPGYNTAEGQNALFSRTTSVWNTALGAFALYGDTTGNGNTAVGINALRRNIIGGSNTAVGLNALFANDSTGHGIAAGNSAVGSYALFSNTDGWGNTAFGSNTLSMNTTADRNTAIGDHALYLNAASANTAVGDEALLNNTDGTANTATGAQALWENSSGNFNTAVGCQALFANNSGGANTAVGMNALRVNTSSGNTAVGVNALAANQTAFNNTAIGANALINNTSGNNNIALGIGAGYNIHTASDTICIGAAGVDVTDGCYIGHVFEESLDPDHLAMAIDVNGKVGTPASSHRFKDDIKPMGQTSEAILALKPVTFHYKNDKMCRPQFGLIAEEVVEVDASLVARDKEGKPYSVRYDQVNAMLLNEFLKEHCKVEKLEATVAEQQKGMEILAAHIKEQDSKLKRVTTQLGLSRPATKVALSAP